MQSVVSSHQSVYENVKNSFHKYKKIVVTGHVIELYEMEKTPYQFSDRKQKKDDIPPDWVDGWTEEISTRSFQDGLKNAEAVGGYFGMMDFLRSFNGRVEKNITRTRNMVRRLALANFDNGSKFVTFTFAENISDLKTANAHWKAFMRKMRDKYGKFKYMAVIEFQKRGAVHYHCIWDLPYLKKSSLAEIWGNGFVKINRIEHVDNVGAYIVKYMTKDLMDERFVSQKAYQCSKGLERPVEFRGEMAEEIILLYDLSKRKSVFESSYTSEHLGKINYQEYNLKRS